MIFPKEALSKVIKKLEESSISYEVNHERHRFLNNNYEVFRSHAFNKLNHEKRVNKIISCINKMNGAEIDEILDYLEKYFYE